MIAEHGDTVEVYSIDESFFRLPVRPDGFGNVAAAHQVRDAVTRSVGLPTRALSKEANALAKASERVWGGVIDLHDIELRRRMFERWRVEGHWRSTDGAPAVDGHAPAKHSSTLSDGVKGSASPNGESK